MDNVFFDPIVAEVRKNREELLADFGGDIKKLDEHIESKRAMRKAAGVRYETADERQARITWNRQRREAEDRRIAAM
jgi:hypothetical protein